MTVARAMELKGIPYKRVELPELAHIPHQKLRFGGSSVPAVRFEDGTKEIGSRPLMRLLDQRVPDPPLVPSDPARRARVLELEDWGDDFQGVPRRLIFWGLQRTPAAFPSYTEGSRWRAPAPIARAVGPGVAKRVMKVHGASDDTTRADLDALPGNLAKIRQALDEGVIGGDPPNAADLQIAPSVRLLLTLDDVVPLVEQAGVADWARGLFPDYGGKMPAGTYPL
ncbi:MAG: glutathione S-transferase [Thermoleophilaceae bacterium]|nr:glutathione S-transferase [Thermoleophilaceae bacterium]